MRRIQRLFIFLVAFSLCSLATGVSAQDVDENNSTPWQVDISPQLRYIIVSGDTHQFREDWGMKEGPGGGLSFRMQKEFTGKEHLEIEGRTTQPDQDYRINARFSKENVGYIHGGFTQYRKYYDDTGGFYPLFSTPSYNLDRNLHLDRGDIYIEAGLKKPKWPQIVLGYEHKYKNGQKSLLEYGSVTEGTVTRNIYPAYKDVDETVDILRVEVDHDVGNVHLGDKFRYENYRSDSTRFERELDLTAGTQTSVTVSEGFDYDALYNTFHMDSHLNDKIYWSIGYLYTRLNGDGNFGMTTLPFNSPFDKDWTSNSIDVNEKAQIINFNTLFGPYYDLTLYGGLQAEKTNIDGDTDALLTEIEFSGAVSSPAAVIVTRQDKSAFQETVGLRYKGLPRTTLYAEGKWAQQSIDLFERELEDNALNFQRYTDTEVDQQRFTVGFNVSPFRRASLSGRYRRRYHSNDYDNLLDSTPNAYSAFITNQGLTTDEVTSRFSFRPVGILKVAVQYQYIHTEYDTGFDTVPHSYLESGDYEANVYGFDFTLTPLARMYLTGMFSYRDSRASSNANGDPAVIPYDADVYTVIGTLGYSLDADSDVMLQYLVSIADNYTDISTVGYPFGVNNHRYHLLATYKRRIVEHVEVRVQYGYYYYDNDSDGGVNDYKAHLIGAGLSFKF